MGTKRQHRGQAERLGTGLEPREHQGGTWAVLGVAEEKGGHGPRPHLEGKGSSLAEAVFFPKISAPNLIQQQSAKQ